MSSTPGNFISTRLLWTWLAVGGTGWPSVLKRSSSSAGRRRLPEGEYFDDELLGMKVYDEPPSANSWANW